MEPELLDRPDLPLAQTRRALRDLRRVNRFIFGQSIPRRAMARVMNGPSKKGCFLLDVAAGTGDAAAGVASALGPGKVRVLSVDRKLSHLVFGRSLGDVHTGVVACASALPFADDSVTWSLSTLFFHHLDESGKTEACREMERVSCRAAVIVDLMPTWWVRALARVVLPALLLGKVARLDGYVSLRRSWTTSQWREFLRDRGSVRIETWFPARVTIELAPENPRRRVDKVRDRT